MYHALRSLSGADVTRGNRAESLINGQATFDSILAGIAQAQQCALVQFYIFHDDGPGRGLQQALIERARAGVHVHMLYEEVGSGGLPASYVDALRAAGVEVSSFTPTRGRGNRFQLNFGNHHKIVGVDGVIAWVGRHDVGDEQVGLDPEFAPDGTRTYESMARRAAAAGQAQARSRLSGGG